MSAPQHVVIIGAGNAAVGRERNVRLSRRGSPVATGQLRSGYAQLAGHSGGMHVIRHRRDGAGIVQDAEQPPIRMGRVQWDIGSGRR